MSKKVFSSLGKSVVTHKEHTKFNSAASEIAGTVERLQLQLKHLEEEIAADKKGQFEYNAALRRLAIDKEDTEARLRHNQEWARNFDEKIKPFEATYDSLGSGIRTLYEDAKVEHEKGIELLVRTFNYHPMFKVDEHGFTGTPFRPK